jgi:hypothetical protein
VLVTDQKGEGAVKPMTYKYTMTRGNLPTTHRQCTRLFSALADMRKPAKDKHPYKYKPRQQWITGKFLLTFSMT